MEKSKETSYILASNGTRFIALAIDSIIVGIVGGLFGANDQWALGGIVGFVIGVAYQWVFLTNYNGQTPGKMMTGIRVIKIDGSDFTLTDVTMRYIGYMINSAVFMIGWLWAFIDENQQGWHDKLARTYVVRAEDF